jgi:hypothetical protein
MRNGLPFRAAHFAFGGLANEPKRFGTTLASLRLKVQRGVRNMQLGTGVGAAGILAVLLMAAPGQGRAGGNGPTGPSGFRSSNVRTMTNTHTVIRDRARVAEQGTSSRPSSRLKAVTTSIPTTDGTHGSPSSGFRFLQRRSCRTMRPMGNPTCSWRRVRCFASSNRKAAHEICRAVTSSIASRNCLKAAPGFSCSGRLIGIQPAAGDAAAEANTDGFSIRYFTLLRVFV